MRVTAPGKLVLTGAYAVLDGAPAVVMAIDRRAIADNTKVDRHPTPEVRAAVGDAVPAPTVNASAFLDETGQKMGLGSSAAAAVAAVAAVRAQQGKDLAHAAVRGEIFRAARAAHFRAQGGGSGVDVAASVYGGVVRYSIAGTPEPTIRSVDWPPGLVMSAYFAGRSARTSELLARVARSKTRRTEQFETLARSMAAGAACAADAIEKGSAFDFVSAARQYGALLGELGRLSDAPIVTTAVAELAALASGEGAAFLPSGAGGGDVAVWLGTSSPPASFLRRARALGARRVNLAIDRDGVRQEMVS